MVGMPGKPGLGRRLQSPAFLRRDGQEAGVVMPMRFHLDEDEQLAMSGNNIQLAAAQPGITIEDGKPLSLQMAGGTLLALATGFGTHWSISSL